jgi:hypothetical protein
MLYAATVRIRRVIGRSLKPKTENVLEEVHVNTRTNANADFKTKFLGLTKYY